MTTPDYGQVSMQRGLTVALLALTGLTLGGCGGGDDPQTRPTSTPTRTTTPSAPPNYSPASVEDALLAEKDIGKGIDDVDIALLPFRERKAPTCSLSGKKLPGKPDLVFRQYANQPKKPRDEVKYAQMFARYGDATGAMNAYGELREQAKKCPSKQHVPAKKIGGNRTLYAHDDTWQVSEGSIDGWQHLRGTEKQTYSRSYTKFNVLHFMYDYSLRGNLLIATVYWERTEPGQSGDSIDKRATAILKKQLQKLG